MGEKLREISLGVFVFQAVKGEVKEGEGKLRGSLAQIAKAFQPSFIPPSPILGSWVNLSPVLCGTDVLYALCGEVRKGRKDELVGEAVGWRKKRNVGIETNSRRRREGES